MKRTIAAIALASTALLVTACGETQRDKIEEAAKANGMTDVQFLACEDFANGIGNISSEDQGARIELAREVNEWAQKGGEDLATAGDSLARTATGSTTSWNVASDGFAEACWRAGWPRPGTVE
ncbi:hypothetical protein [Rhodococcus spongiicola]|uniref:Lipoprotein n=1 Tax=Rhodococcus spongiicola TaxID=2487352 RepID=A0A3S3AB86_9NOCA|nr:hypothetical protein [Rhodococcus spongiicola]RVW06212.1 hypothetical protein EF834_01790 [Rhodococcus spongiicola]